MKSTPFEQLSHDDQISRTLFFEMYVEHARKSRTFNFDYEGIIDEVIDELKADRDSWISKADEYRDMKFLEITCIPPQRHDGMMMINGKEYYEYAHQFVIPNIEFNIERLEKLL